MQVQSVLTVAAVFIIAQEPAGKKGEGSPLGGKATPCPGTEFTIRMSDRERVLLG